MNENDNNGWVKLWTASGVQVTLPVPFADPASMLAYTDSYLTAGWLVNAPNLEAGEYKEAIGYVCRMTFVNKDSGVKTPKIALYPDNQRAKFKCGQVYLDTSEEITAFEHATGLSLNAIAEYPSDAAPQRDGSGAQFIVPVQRATVAIFRRNEKYVEGGKDQPKNYFVRWDGATPKTESPAPANGTNTQTPTSAPKNAPKPASVPQNGTPEEPYIETPDGSITTLKRLTRADVATLQTKWNAEGLSNAEIMTALGVQLASLFEGDYADADALVAEFHKTKEIAF